jgi:hypothetical protein
MYILVFMGLGLQEPRERGIMAGAGLAGEKGVDRGFAAEVEGAV